jgi:predicted PurR-regulated permease PerM
MEDRNRWLSTVLRTALLVLFVWMVRTLLVPIALGALFSLLLGPLAARLERRMGRAARFLPLLLTAGALVLVVIPFTLVAFKAVQAINDFLSRAFPGAFARLQASLTDGVDLFGCNVHIGGAELRTAIEDVAQRAAAFLAGLVGGFCAGVPGQIVGLFLFVVALYYFLRDGSLDRWAFRLSPFAEAQTRELLASVRETVNGAILGLIITSLVQGGFCLLALYAFGVPNAFLLGVLATLLAFVPVVGTTPVTVGATAYLFMVDRVGASAGMLVAAVFVGLVDNVIRPWVQSSKTSMHPLVALLGIFGGLELFGPAGVFLGPVVAAMALWTLDTYARRSVVPRRVSSPPPVLSIVPAGIAAEELRSGDGS